MSSSRSNRIISTPSSYAKEHFLYVQEIGFLKSIEPHISSRKNLNSFLFLVVTSGSGNFTYNNQTISLTSGDCAFIDCRNSYSHESSLSNPWELAWIHFNGNQAHHFYQNFIDLDYKIFFKPYHLTSFIDIITILYQIQKEQGSLAELTSNKYLTDIITLCYSENEVSPSSTKGIYDKMLLVRSYIETNFAEKISLDLLSDLFYISKFHLSREFKKIFGITIGNDIIAKRISHSKSLLRYSNESIEQIAITCGFLESGYFIKVFKKFENSTPLEYRKKW